MRAFPPLFLWMLFAGVAALLCGLYRALTPEVSDFGDSSELTLVLATNGVAHPTGYPLYVLFGHAFVRLAHGLGVSWAEGASAWSTLGAGVALVFLQRTAFDLCGLAVPRAGDGVRAFAAAIPTIALGLHPVWVLEATHAEVYTWHVAWALIATWFFLRLATGPAPDRKRWHRSEPLVAGLLVGAGLAHHRTSAILIGALLAGGLLVAIRDARAQRRAAGAGRPAASGRTGAWIAIALAGALLPLSSYGLIAYRAFHPAEVQWPVLGPAWDDVLAHVNGREFLHYIGRFAPDPQTLDLLARWVYPGLVVGVFGLVASALLAGRALRSASARLSIGTIAAGAAVATGASFAYGVPDPGTYFLMPMALGAAGVAPLLLPGLGRGKPRMAGIALAGLSVAGLAWLCATSLSLGGERRAAVTANDGIVREMWEALPPDSAIVLWPWDAYTKLHEYQRFAGEKPAVYVANPALLGYPNARRAFLARFGVDPIAGLAAPHIRSGAPSEERELDALYLEIARSVNAQTRLPVIYMDPRAGILQRLAKPSATPAP